MTEGIPLSYLRNLYRDAYAAIRRVAGTGPVVVFSDAGQPGAWRRFMAHERYENVWLDTHPYRHTDKVDAAGPAGARLLAARSADVTSSKTRQSPAGTPMARDTSSKKAGSDLLLCITSTAKK